MCTVIVFLQASLLATSFSKQIHKKIKGYCTQIATFIIPSPQRTHMFNLTIQISLMWPNVHLWASKFTFATFRISTQRQESWMWALLLTALRAVGAGEGNCTQECILHMYSYKLTAGNLSGSCLALECFKPIPQNSLHFPEAQYFLSLLSWLLLSSSTAKPSLHYLTLHWTQIPSAGWKLHSKLILFIAILVYLHTF